MTEREWDIIQKRARDVAENAYTRPRIVGVKGGFGWYYTITLPKVDEDARHYWPTGLGI